MATTIPRPPRQPMAPSNMGGSSLSVAKNRHSSMGMPTMTRASQTPRTSLRVPTSLLTNTASGNPLSQLKSPQSATSPAGPLRKSLSIASFPQPPRGDHRNSGVPSSPMVAARSRSTRKSRLSRESFPSAASSPITSPLVEGGENKFINSVRMSDGMISMASPTHSRSSSAQDSYSTSATNYDDLADSAGASASDKRLSKFDVKGNVLVSVRVRPDASTENNEGDWVVDNRQSLIAYRGKEGGEYFYDNVFATNDNNARVYDHIAKRLVRRVMEGYHGTVFAYGQTGTGKTFSMQGTASSPGVIPLAITDIFSYIRETPSREFLLRVSYLEIYNEKIHDLLSMSTGGGAGGNGQQEEIKLREDSKRGVYATPLKEEIVQSPTQLLRVIARGDQARRVASTQFNARSSRSHAVVQIVVESRERMAGSTGGPADNKRSAILPGGVRVSTLSLIDLAGSEKAAESKERRQEGAHINKSLLTLGTVIAKLSEWKDKGSDKEGKHLPYRDSKLTRLLQGALSGDSLVSILCTIQVGASGSQASSNTHINETLNTLKFASRAKNSIVSHAKKAEDAAGVGVDGNARVLLERYRMEILELRQQLEAQANKKSDFDKDLVEEERAREKEANERHEEQMLEMHLARTALKERIDHLNRLILSSKSIGVNASGTMSASSRYSQMSVSASVRSSMATTYGGKPLLERSASMASASSAVARFAGSAGQRLSGEGEGEGMDVVGDESVGEFGDGMASLAAQNRALQADLTDKNRYIATLEKRLVQARRASSSRTSVAFSAPTKSIMVGEDHSVAVVLREKDAEIAELRTRLDDKERMLAALRMATRSRDATEATTEASKRPQSPPLPPQAQTQSAEQTPWSPSSRKSRRRTRSVDEMNKMLEEMIQDRVEKGHIVRGARGSVRLASGDALGEPPSELPPLRHVPSPIGIAHMDRVDVV